LSTFDGIEDQVVAKSDPLTQKEYIATDSPAARGELALFVELPVVRQVGLRNKTKHAAAVDYYAAVEELSVEPQRGTGDEDGNKGPTLGNEVGDGSRRSVEEGVLVKEVFVGVGGNPQLWEKRDRRIQVRRASREA
jgi:hypothetical protein